MAEDTTPEREAPQGQAGEPTGLNTPRNIRRLKFVVGGMGAVLVLGFAVIVAVIIQRAGSLGERAAARPAGEFGVSRVAVAPGERVRSVTMTDDRLAIHVGSDSAEAIVIVSVKTGEELGRILLTPMSGFASRE
ncbi:DUF6476 family protein [Parvibaculum sp.]|uniref:DUF6476 family protein n=1 Tax=Parvibaculum sp. TaxID=2024848 RepID=UPI00272033F3|nr:DUF6476 family protein [Parvibaculum sp.]MDO9127379.1 DUF6476 family protein [Parvibaculum sp.]MDP1628791.1 DUF6476 family protein [Parvibaculum sp.]MDP2148186.1 DUF6476 family protein [Parvibaculum sp.]MDP3328267.1 DUF6476 family protein [Parvibaculum sp.]